ncbi:hypothetical protein L2E82_25465 [Cichorium intybus]|uniref:Uncharacterized protein n=1 Tax=Cichorium intybus TaxID=13427 RepID=A0ACB9E338_CICIN|nr:hypothetical protein L2E82_25465 [Cichorium intybus]
MKLHIAPYETLVERVWFIGTPIGVHKELQWVYRVLSLLMERMSSADQTAPQSNSNVTSILSLCSKVTLDGTNYNDWIRNIKMALRFEHKEYVLETELIEIDPDTATPDEIAQYSKHSDDATKVACIMIATMNPELQRIYEDY